MKSFLAPFGLGVGLLFLLSPALGLLLSCSPSELFSALQHPLFWPALKLSLLTSLCSIILIIVMTTPLAWYLAHTNSPYWQRLSRVLLDLPLILPPALIGVSLLAVWGSQGWGGLVLKKWGLQIPFTSLAVILAQCIVAAPFYLQSAISTFQMIHLRHFEAASSLGATPFETFYRVVLPLSWPGLLNGCALAWGRALGEFGATLVFAGNLKGMTQTLPLAIYTALETDLNLAIALSVWLMALGASILVMLRF